MNWDQIEGQWQQLAGKAKSRWGKLTDDDLTNVAGKKDQLIGKLQERYGFIKADAEKQVDRWIAKFLDSSSPQESPHNTKKTL